MLNILVPQFLCNFHSHCITVFVFVFFINISISSIFILYIMCNQSSLILQDFNRLTYFIYTLYDAVFISPPCVLIAQLSQLGCDAFIAAEGNALLQMKLPDNCIMSLSGSNPLHQDAMRWIRSFGKVIFLDTHYSDIVARTPCMKVDRIVGYGRDLVENLHYRQQFYEGIKYDCI